jgi:hypothetical protein
VKGSFVAKKIETDFNLNTYSFFFTCRDEKAITYKGNGKKFSIKIIEEHENLDGVFIFLESNLILIHG